MSTRGLKLFLIVLVSFFLVLNPILIEASYLAADAFTEYKYSFNGRHILYARDKLRNEAYEWIRDNTPRNSLLMLSYIKTLWPCCGYNTNYERAAMTERTLYVITDKDYTVSDPEYSNRILYREKLFADPEDKSVADYFSKLNRQVYLLIEDNLDENTYFVENRFIHFPENPGWPFVLKFKNSRQRVYLIDVKKSSLS